MPCWSYAAFVKNRQITCQHVSNHEIPRWFVHFVVPCSVSYLSQPHCLVLPFHTLFIFSLINVFVVVFRSVVTLASFACPAAADVACAKVLNRRCMVPCWIFTNWRRRHYQLAEKLGDKSARKMKLINGFLIIWPPVVNVFHFSTYFNAFHWLCHCSCMLVTTW